MSESTLKTHMLSAIEKLRIIHSGKKCLIFVIGICSNLRKPAIFRTIRHIVKWWSRIKQKKPRSPEFLLVSTANFDMNFEIRRKTYLQIFKYFLCVLFLKSQSLRSRCKSVAPDWTILFLTKLFFSWQKLHVSGHRVTTKHYIHL